jgi:hypothetical protein
MSWFVLGRCHTPVHFRYVQVSSKCSEQCPSVHYIHDLVILNPSPCYELDRPIYLLLLERYSPLWTLASNTIVLHSWRSLATACQFLIPIIFKSSSTSFIHLLCGLHLFPVPSILVVIIFLGILSLFILSICPHNQNLRDFIKGLYTYHTETVFSCPDYLLVSNISKISINWSCPLLTFHTLGS